MKPASFLHRNPSTRSQLEELLKSQPELLYDFMMHLFDKQEYHLNRNLLQAAPHSEMYSNHSPGTPLSLNDISMNTPESNESNETSSPGLVDVFAIKEEPGPLAQGMETIETVMKRGRGRPRFTTPTNLRNLRSTSYMTKANAVAKKVRFARKGTPRSKNGMSDFSSARTPCDN